ncbi:hypothetical protein QUF64_10550 [Anaerolineales bacterium HSG6]|nr:hypothetical protein [Anaerolineales bacterium HSG6]
MLDKIDLTKKIKKKQYKALLPDLRNRLFQLQYATQEADIPVVLVFEGWDLAGKGDYIQRLTTRLDPRGFKLYPIRPVRTFEKKRPWLWRFWNRIPAQGEWGIFDRSWYGRVLVERMENVVPKAEWSRAYRDIVDFERTLADDGYLIVKFFLHISSQEQRERIKELSEDPLTAWRVKPEDTKRNKQYNQWVYAYEEMFEHTDTEWGTWTIVEATDAQYARIKIFRTLISALEERLGEVNMMPDKL